MTDKIKILDQRVNIEGSRAWNMSTTIYTQSGTVIREEGCFAFMFTNIGDTTARVNGMVIFPSTAPATILGDSRSLSGHVLDLYKGLITLAFDFPVNANPAVEIVQLFYANQTVK